MNEKIRELERKIRDEKIKEEKKLEILVELTKLLSDLSSPKNKKYTEQALGLSQKLNKKDTTLNLLIGIGIFHKSKCDYHRALECFETSKKLAEDIADTNSVITNLINIGNTYKILGDFDKALSCLNEALKLSKTENIQKGIADCNNNLGNVYKDISDYDKALEYHLKALKIREERNDKKGVTISLHNIGIIYYKLNFREKALDYFQRSLNLKKEIKANRSMPPSLIAIGSIYIELKEYDLAVDYFMQAYQIYDEHDDRRGISYCYNDLGYLSEKKENYPIALEYYQKAVQIRTELEDKRGSANSLKNIGNIFFRLGDNEKAIQHLEDSLKIAKELDIKDIIKDCYHHFSEIYSAQLNYQEAFEYHKLYTEEKEIIFNKDISKQISEIQVKYEIEKKEKEADIYRLKNVELAKSNRDLRTEIQKRQKVEKELKKHEEKLEKLITERTLKLRENEQKLKNILESSPNAITVTNLNGIITESNQATLDLHGYSSCKELIGKNAFELITPDDRERAIENMKTTIDKGSIKNIEYSMIKKDGSIFECELSANVIKGPSGKITSLIATTTDISKRKKLERAIKESEQKYRLLADHATDTISLHAMDGTFIYISPSCKQAGYEPEELIGKTPFDFYHPEDAERLGRLLSSEEGLKNNPVFTFRFRRKDGTYLWTEAYNTLAIDPIKNNPVVISVSRDISERKKVEEAFRESEAHFRSLLENAKDYVIYRLGKGSLQFESKVIKVSPSLTRIAGVSEQDLYDFPKWFTVIHPEDLERIGKANIKGFSPPYKFDEIFRINHPQNGLRWLHVKSNGIVDKNKNLTYVNGLITDITDIKKAEEEVKKELQEKKLLLQEVYHRVKNNMQVISSLLKLQSGALTDARLKKILTQVDNRIRSMALIHQRLYETEDYVNIDFDNYLKNLTMMLFRSYQADPSKIELNLDVTGIKFDIGKAIPVALIVNELISNSLEHAFPGDRKGKISVSLKYEKGEYKLKVSDNGIGFPENIDFQNSGSFGLDLVNTLTTQLNGSLELIRNKKTIIVIKFRK